MDYIKVVRAGDLVEITIALDKIVSFRDNEDDTGHISLMNGEYVETAKPISVDLRKTLSLMGKRIMKVGE